MSTQKITFSRRQTVEARTGGSRSKIYQDMADGLFPKPVKIGVRAVAWIDSEVEAINAARVAGKSAEEIKALVIRLESARKQVAE